MSDNTCEESQVCEACGCAGEVGFIIKEGDEVADVVITGESKALIEDELAKYVAVAKQVNENVTYETSPLADDTKELTAKFKFEVSAEKIIFELKSRSVSR